MKPLVIVGAGGHGRTVASLVRDINAHRPTWEILGFVDDAPEEEGPILEGLEVLGGMDWLVERRRPPFVALGIGNPATRRRLALRLRDHAAGFPSLVHPSVLSTPTVEMGVGVTLCAGDILTTNIRIGDFVLINLACSISHDTRIESYVTVAPGVNVAGAVTLGEGCDLGTGTSTIQGTSVGAWSIVGAGATVVEPIPPNVTAVGVPARPIKERPAGWHEERDHG